MTNDGHLSVGTNAVIPDETEQNENQTSSATDRN